MIKQLAIILLFCSWAIAVAQEPIRYTTKQGLPTNHIYDIAEDENGFMWFATKQGLVKYNGETFKTLTIQDGLPNNDTWLLETDYQGRLWYFSKSNQQGFIKNDSIYKFFTQDSKVITPRYVYKSKDTLWMHSDAGLQTLVNKQFMGEGKLDVKLFSIFYKKIKNELKEYNIVVLRDVLLFNPELKEWTVIKQNEILFFDFNFNFISKTKINLPNAVRNQKIENLGYLYNQIMYYATDTGVVFINTNTKIAKYLAFKDFVTTETARYFRCKALQGEIQVSIPGHLLTLDYNLKVTNTYSFDKDLSRTSHKDRNGNLWLADFSNGLTLKPNTQNQTKYYLSNKKVQKISSMDNALYTGVNDNGYYKLEDDTFNEITKFTRANAEIYQIKKDVESQNQYLISSANSYVKTGNNMSAYELDLVDGSSIQKQFGFKDIMGYKGQNYLIGGNILMKTNNYESTKAELVNRKSGLLHTTVFKDKLYLSGSDGLHKLVKDSLVKPQLKNELLNVSISSVTSTSDYLMVGTDGRGVYFYNEDKLHHLKHTDGLSVQRIIQQDNYIWLATQKGIKKVALLNNNLSESKIIDAFYEADGLLQNNTNDIYLEDNLLYAASDIGLTKLNLNSTVYKQTPKLYFTKQQDTLSFKNSERDNISISFSALDFVNQEHLSYEYRLLPSQKQWTSTETKTLNFSNLSPKTYTLEVRATDQHNNSGVIRQHLNVIPQWWQSKGAIIGFCLVGIGLFVLFLNQLKKRIQQREQLKAQQEKRIAGLELQALRSQMNPHFVHNSLNAIQYYIQRNEIEFSENYLVKFSKLIRLFFEYSRRQTITIKEEIELITYYLEIEKLRFEEKLNFNISVCDNIDAEEQTMPSMLLQPLVENAVNHGIFHKHDNGIVNIDFRKVDDFTFKVLVTDDGIGIKEAKNIYKRSSKNYQSNSSAVLHERITLLNQSKEWHILYEIQDRSEIDDGKGTIVSLTFNQPEA